MYWRTEVRSSGRGSLLGATVIHVSWIASLCLRLPLIACVIAGSAQFRERDIGAGWLTRQLRRGDIFVTRSKTPYEVRFSSPVGEEIDVISIHLAVDRYLAALHAAYSDKAKEVEVIDFFGRDEALAHLCFACAEMLL